MKICKRLFSSILAGLLFVSTVFGGVLNRTLYQAISADYFRQIYLL